MKTNPIKQKNESREVLKTHLNPPKIKIFNKPICIHRKTSRTQMKIFFLLETSRRRSIPWCFERNKGWFLTRKEKRKRKRKKVNNKKVKGAGLSIRGRRRKRRRDRWEENVQASVYFSGVVSGSSVLRVSSLRWFVTESNEREREKETERERSVQFFALFFGSSLS